VVLELRKSVMPVVARFLLLQVLQKEKLWIATQAVLELANVEMPVVERLLLKVLPRLVWHLARLVAKEKTSVNVTKVTIASMKHTKVKATTNEESVSFATTLAFTWHDTSQ